MRRRGTEGLLQDHSWQPKRPARRERAVLLALASSMVFAVHLLASRDAVGPMVFEDEIGYLMNSRAIVEGGSNVRIGPMGFYYSGWSLAFAPLTAIINDPYTLYQWVLVLVAALGAAQVVPLAWLAQRVLGMEFRASVAAASVAAIYPGRTVMAGYAYSEAFFAIVFLLAAVAIVRWLDRRTVPMALAIGVATGSLYWVHGRGLGMVVASVILSLGAAAMWRSWRPLTILVGLAPTLIVGELLNQWLKSNLYSLGFSRFSAGASSIGGLQPRSLASATVGPVWYMAVGSLGLAGIGIVVLFYRSWTSIRSRELAVEQWYLLTMVFLGGIIVPGFANSVAGGDRRLDYVIYGRHWDAILPFAVLVGASILVTATSRRHLLWASGGGIAVIAGSAAALKLIALPAYLGGLPIAALSVGAIAPWIDPAEQRIPIWEATLSAVVVMAVLAAVPVRWWWARLGIVALAFTAMAWQAEFSTMRQLDGPWQQTVTLQNVIGDLGPSEAAYDTDRQTLYGRNGYSFWLRDYDLEQFDSSIEPIPTELVIARTFGSRPQALGALPYASEARVNETIWVMPGSWQDRLRLAGELCQPSLVAPELVDVCG